MKKFMTILITISILSLLFTSQIFADEKEVPYLDYFSKVILPPEQVSNKSYVDIILHKNETLDVEIEVGNTGDKQARVDVVLTNGVTGIDATKDYESVDKGSDVMNYPFNEIAVVDTQDLVLNPGENKKITVTVTMPNADVKGPILGGVITKASTIASTSSTEEGTSIENEITYLHAFKISSETMDTALDLDLKGIKVSSYDGIPNFVITGINLSGVNAQEAIITGEVIDISNDIVKGMISIEEGYLLPYSDFSLNYKPLKRQTISSGKYQAYLKIEVDGKEWEWVENFTITQEDIKEISVQNEKNKDSNYMIYFMVGGSVVIGVLVYLVLKQQRKLAKMDHKDEDKK